MDETGQEIWRLWRVERPPQPHWLPHEWFLNANPDIEKAWSLYALIDPRFGSIFYIGITTDPRARTCQHRLSPDSAAYWRIREIHADRSKCIMKILRTYTSEDEAVDDERRLIGLLPGLVNKSRPARRKDSKP